MGIRPTTLLYFLMGLLWAIVPEIALAIEPPATIEAKLSHTALHAGEQASIAIIVDVHPGLHAQSHTPLDDSLIPLVVNFKNSPSATFGDPVYPLPKIESYAALGQVSVYEGRAVILVPLTVIASAAPGSITLSGTVRLQACNQDSCFPPVNLPFDLAVNIVPHGEATTAIEPSLFSITPTSQAITVPTTAPAIKSAASPPQGQILGFDLNKNAYVLAFGAAFLVGIIFNAMPCVLPVVPLKIMGFYEASHHDRKKSLALGAVFSAGLVASFAVLAILVVGLHALDWGGLFQKTWFTMAIVIVLTLMAFSLFGVFTVNLPTGIYNFTPRHDTYTGNFLFGILTAALSTPCTFGMFVTLLSWTASQPAVIGVALVMTVGVGMAFPYFVLSGFPEAARRFPRTGPWSELVKQLLAFLVLATAVYFAQPLFERFVSDRACWWAIFAVIAGGAVFLVVRSLQLSSQFVPRIIAVIIAIGVLIPSLLAACRLTARPFEWKPYSDEALVTADKQHVVLVDFTATWCGNCHFIEGFVLNNPQVIAAVRDNDVILLKADVTDTTAPGKPLLAKLNPAGAIPLTAVYTPGNDQPQLLAGIYSVADVVNAIKSARNPAS